MSIPENILNTLTDEQKKKIEAAQSPEELQALSEEAGMELTPDQLKGVSGGRVYCLRDSHCPDRTGHVQGVV